MSIRGKYRSVICNIFKEYESTVVDNPGYVVDKNASLGTCIGYTKQFIYDGSQPHYRYDRYYKCVGLMATKGYFRKHINRVLHVDIGSGPGLFSWVMYDYFAANHAGNRYRIDLYSYDAARNMKRLAKIIWKKFDLPVSLHYYTTKRRNKMLSRVRKKIKKYKSKHGVSPYIVITFGHVLIQAAGNHRAIEDFAGIIGFIAQESSCYLLAIDAHTRPRPEIFEAGWKKLENSLAKDYGASVNVAHKDAPLRCAKVEIGGRR